jgi:predicted SprT family Zn-dependent metalloprotease
MQAEFRNRVRECLHLAESLYGVDFGRVRIDFDLTGTVAGMARTIHYRDRSVYSLRFNRQYIEHDYDFMVSSTIPHEVAHLIQGARPDFGSEGHDYKWRSFAQALGDSERGSRYHSM